MGESSSMTLGRIAELCRETCDVYRYQESGIFEQQKEQMDRALSCGKRWHTQR